MQAISSDILSLINTPQNQDQDSNDLGQDDFINLMITQLRNQDPFEPSAKWRIYWSASTIWYCVRN